MYASFRVRLSSVLLLELPGCFKLPRGFGVREPSAPKTCMARKVCPCGKPQCAYCACVIKICRTSSKRIHSCITEISEKAISESVALT